MSFKIFNTGEDMEKNISSFNFSSTTCLVLGNKGSVKPSENEETSIDLLVTWLLRKKLNVITDRYEIENMLKEKKPFDIIFISYNSRGADILLDSCSDCCFYVRRNFPDAYIVIVDQHENVAQQKILQNEVVRILKSFTTYFNNIVFMSHESMNMVLEDYKIFVLKSLGKN